MNNNKIEPVVRLVLDRAKRLPVGLVLAIVRSLRPDNMSAEGFEEYLQFKLGEMVRNHTILGLNSASEPAASFNEIVYFASHFYDKKFFNAQTLKNYSAALWAIWAYGKHGDDASDVATFQDLSFLYCMDAPFQFFFGMGVVDEKETMPLECFDIACLDPVSLDASIAACKRFWKMQAKPSLSKKERMQQEVDKLYGRDTHQDDADSAQNGEGEMDTSLTLLCSWPILARIHGTCCPGLEQLAFIMSFIAPAWKINPGRPLDGGCCDEKLGR